MTHILSQTDFIKLNIFINLFNRKERVMSGENEMCKILICSFEDKYPDLGAQSFLNLQEIICRLTQDDFRKTFYMKR